MPNDAGSSARAPAYAYNCTNRTLRIENVKNTIVRTIVNWKSVFSSPRRVRLIEESLLNAPLPIVFDCKMMTTTSAIAAKI